MTIGVSEIFQAMGIGLGATFVMDLWLYFRKRILNSASLNYCYLGRWILHMPFGVFWHADIAAARERQGECAVGRVAHYSIGAVFGVGLLLVAPASWLTHPTLIPAVLWGMVTVAAPFFLMQPAFGLGFAASKNPNPMKARVQSLLTHTVFGVGLYLSALLLGFLLNS